MSWKNWVRGLFAAIIGGAAGAVSLVVVDSDTFNLQTGLQKLLAVAGVNALVAGAAYLKQHPVPGETISTLMVLIVAVSLLPGCAQTIQRSADGLVLTQQTVISTATAVDNMCTAGLIDQGQCDTAAVLYAEAKTAYSAALAAEQLAIDTAIASTGSDVTTETTNYSTAVAAWTTVAAEYITFAAELGLLED